MNNLLYVMLKVKNKQITETIEESEAICIFKNLTHLCNAWENIMKDTHPAAGRDYL